MSLPLRCLGGAPAPEMIRKGWTHYQNLPESVQEEIWELVSDGLIHPTSRSFRARFDTFREEHDLEEDTLRGALQACGLLLSQSAALDMNSDQVRADLTDLSENRQNGWGPLLSCYESLKTELRETMVFGSLSDHGKVLTGLDWRVDRVASSNRAAQLGTDVVYLTLRYQEGEEEGRITLQISSQGILDLKAFMARFGS